MGSSRMISRRLGGSEWLGGTSLNGVEKYEYTESKEKFDTRTDGKPLALAARLSIRM
jgi:hypothetical protein